MSEIVSYSLTADPPMPNPDTLNESVKPSWLRAVPLISGKSLVEMGFIATFVAFLYLGVLSGCGFHLRGKVELPPEMSRTYITGLPQFTEFGANLRRQLRANGVVIVEDADESTATLRVTRNRTGKRVLSVNDKGKVQEFELYVSVAFDVKDQDKSVLLENQTISLRREFLFDENDVLGKAQEEQLVFRNMRKDLVRLMIFRLQTIGKV